MRHKYEIALAPRAPFHFDATMHKPDHFPAADNAWVPGVRWQTMRWQGSALGLKFELFAQPTARLDGTDRQLKQWVADQRFAVADVMLVLLRRCGAFGHDDLGGRRRA